MTTTQPLEVKAAEDQMVPRPYRVISVHKEIDSVSTLWMEPADGGPCLRFLPAQTGMVGLPGLGEVPISFSSDPRDPRVAMTIRACGKVTSALVNIQPGAIVTIRGPYGAPWPMEKVEGGHLAVIAGGIGLAPLRSLVVQAVNTWDRYKGLTLIYGVRTPEDLLFKSDLEDWKNRGMEVLLAAEKPTEDWTGYVGNVSVVLPGAVSEDTNAVICGPDVMLRHVGAQLMSLGVPAQQIWVTLERNMKCSIGLCGHCHFGPYLICRDGPVFRWDEVLYYQIPEV
jgi:NAD(P)H-flavin reductase